MVNIVIIFLAIAGLVSAIYFWASKRDTKGKIKRIVIGTLSCALGVPFAIFMILVIALSSGNGGM